jgi:amino acid transporter
MMSVDGAGTRAAGAGSGPGLRTGELSFVEVLFQSLASAAPGLSVTLAVIVGASFAGGALPLALVLALVGILLVAVCIGQMAQRFPSAGGFYTYVARGLHPSLGPLVAWFYLIVWVVFPSTLFLPFGDFISKTCHSDFGWSVKPVWIVSSLLCIVIVFVCVFYGAKFSTNVSVTLGLVEFAILGALAAWLIVRAGGDNTLQVFTTKFANVKGFAGASGLIGAMVYAIYGFVGFENVVPLAEEAKDPRRSVARVTFLAPLILGVFILVCTYAAAVYFGASRFSAFPSSNNGDAWIGLAKAVWGKGWYILLFALLNSCIASANGATNAATRHLFAMSRNRLLPAPFAQVSEDHGTPVVALVSLMAVSVAVTLVTGLWLDPLRAFAFLGTIETAVAILLYILVVLACLVYFLRNRAEWFNPLLHVVVPIAAFVVMIPTLMAALGVGSGLFSFITPFGYPYNVAGGIAVAWVLAGFVYAAIVWIRFPERAARTETIFVEPG